MNTLVLDQVSHRFGDILAVDGVSLTVNEVSGNQFSVNIVPHTLEQTIMGHYIAGTRVNMEVDLIARYLERLMSQQG